MKICINKTCEQNAYYNFVEYKKALFCKDHKLKNMVYVYKYNCIYPKCQITPTFNFKGEKTRIYCSLHKLHGMINLKAKYCNFDGCNTQISYKRSKKEYKFCSKHNKFDSINDTIN